MIYIKKNVIEFKEYDNETFHRLYGPAVLSKDTLIFYIKGKLAAIDFGRDLRNIFGRYTNDNYYYLRYIVSRYKRKLA